MLDSLEIKNYRNLKDLKIASLSPVNLITGKNNTGKSTFLEAISLYASKCDINWILQLLEERGENYKSVQNNLDSLEANVKTFSSLFSDRNIKFSLDDSILIGIIGGRVSDDKDSNPKSISIKFVRYIDEIEKLSERNPNIIRNIKRTILPEVLNNITDFHMGIELREAFFSYVLSLEEEVIRRQYRSVTPPDNFQLIRTRNIDREINGKLWDSITLTEKEGFVVEALKIIEPNIERITFIEDNGRERKPVIKIKGDNNVLPLKSMGDGLNRILTIILALVNFDNGYLLIDEFENGLHYSVQEKLWEIIFKLSQKLNIQVFATTHSEDCIRGFESILNSNPNINEGKLIRLDNFNGTIKQTEFNASELKTASENNIETR